MQYFSRLNRRARRSRQFQSLELMLRHEGAVCEISKPSQSSQQQSPQNNISATHKALNIGDILFTILDFLDPHLLEKDFAEKEKKSKKSLLSVHLAPWVVLRKSLIESNQCQVDSPLNPWSGHSIFNLHNDVIDRVVVTAISSKMTRIAKNVSWHRRILF